MKLNLRLSLKGDGRETTSIRDAEERLAHLGKEGICRPFRSAINGASSEAAEYRVHIESIWFYHYAPRASAAVKLESYEREPAGFR